MKIKIPYKPRPWQIAAHKNLTRFSVCVLHRRAGKTVFAVNELIKQLIDCEHKSPCGAYIAPNKEQAKKVVWEYMKEFANPLPGFKANENELKVEFLTNNGKATIYLLGAEKYDSIRGMYFDYVVIDEVADMPQPAWEQVIRPALMDRHGGALFIGTPKGMNVFYQLYKLGLSEEGMKDGWSSLLLTWKDSQVVPEYIPMEEIEAYKNQNPDAFDQEYNCSFSAAIKGTYFDRNLHKAEKEKRIRRVPYDNAYPVHTGWDIGLDGTAIWFAQIIGPEVRIIDYELYIDKDIPEVLRKLNKKKYTYGIAFLPHDGQRRSVVDKSKTPRGMIENAGIRTRKTPKVAVNDGIIASKNIIDKALFDRGKCEMGLDSLRLYRARYNINMGVSQQTPLHDINSHAGSAFNTLSLGINRRTNDLVNYELTDERPLWEKVIRPQGQGQLAITEWNVLN